MGQSIIEVEHLAKRYRLGTTSLRDAIGQWRRRRPTSAATGQPGDFWAIQDVSFSVQPGSVVGVMGHNGAGKSVLLKILSRITEPTSGRAVLRGRVASLLEVGSGFHPDLTGRENIFINGAILGMTRTEIRGKFDEIVAFAEVEQFIDTPVKHYSSGMYVRLAFAVAAHLDPEVLIVDEVLAVGDAAFQKKCLGKMESASRQEGRTILLVSHNMSAVRHLCTHGLYLDHGRLLAADSVEACVRCYLSAPTAAEGMTLDGNRSGSGLLRFTGFWIENDRGERVTFVGAGEPCTLVFTYANNGCPPGRNVDVGFGLHAPTNERLLLLYASHVNQAFTDVHAAGQFRCRLPGLPLATGRYRVYPRIEVDGAEADFPRAGAGDIEVDELNYYGTGRKMASHGHGHSYFLIRGDWEERPAPPGQAARA